MRAFVDERGDLASKIETELDYQEYLHKKKVEKYNITNLDLFKPRSAKDKKYEEYCDTAS